MFGCTKENTMSQIVHLFIWFAQVVVAVICMGIALVVCEADELRQNEATHELKESPAKNDEIPAKKADVRADEVSSRPCERDSIACLDLCRRTNSWFTTVCSARCNYLTYMCKGLLYAVRKPSRA